MKLCIDPGHGMDNRKAGKYDPGAVSGNIQEADVALLWALTLKFTFTQAGIPCFMTRDDALDSAPVGKRACRAEAAGCTHFVSLHCNAGVPSAKGTETYHGEGDKADIAWAGVVQAAAMKAMKSSNRGLKSETQSQHKSLAVLRFAGPACLLEIGFISNDSDRARMLEPARRIAFAKELLAAVQP